MQAASHSTLMNPNACDIAVCGSGLGYNYLTLAYTTSLSDTVQAPHQDVLQ